LEQDFCQISKYISKDFRFNIFALALLEFPYLEHFRLDMQVIYIWI